MTQKSIYVCVCDDRNGAMYLGMRSQEEEAVLCVQQERGKESAAQ